MTEFNFNVMPPADIETEWSQSLPFEESVETVVGDFRLRDLRFTLHHLQ